MSFRVLSLPACLAIVLLPLSVVAQATSSPVKAALKPSFALKAPAPQPSNGSCPVPPVPMVALSITSKYGNDGPQRDTIDPVAAAAEEKQMAPLRAYGQGVVKLANRYTRTGRVADAACALTWLDAWASGKALAQMNDPNAVFQRAVALSGLSLALLQISPAVSGDPRYPSVTAWMHDLASATIRFFDSTTRLKGSRNNHVYWGGLAVAGIAVASDDRKLLAWSAQTYKKAVCDITAEGGLPLELQRGSKALSYHLYALSALVPLAAMLERNGSPAFDMCDGALHRVVRFSFDALADPAAITALAGKAQDPVDGGVPSGNQIAFVEIYHRYFPGKLPQEEKWLALRPLTATNLGGDQTLLYGN